MHNICPIVKQVLPTLCTENYTTMKKIIALLTVLLFVSGLEAAAIGLPNNAYIQQKAEIHHRNIEKNQDNLLLKGNELMVRKTDNISYTNKKSTLDSPGDIATYSKALVARLVHFIAATLLGFFSASHSIADEAPILHNWLITGLPPKC